jgi:hypothetical protein
MPTCAADNCSATFPPTTGRGRTRIYCSDECRKRSHDAKLLAAEFPLEWQRTALAHGWAPPGGKWSGHRA